MTNKKALMLLLILCLSLAAHASAAAKSSSPSATPTPRGSDAGGRQEQDAKEEALRREIQSKLRAAGLDDIDVSVRRDTVTLAVNVSSKSARDNAIEIVRKVKGVNPNNIRADDLKAPTAGGDAATAGPSPASDTAASKQSTAENRPENHEDTSWSFTSLLYSLLLVLGVVLAVGLIGYAIWMYVRSRRAQLDGHFNGLKRRQDELSHKIDASMSTLKKELAERLNSMDDQLRNLSMILKNDHREILEAVRRSSTAPAYAASAGQPAVQRESVHTFPVSAEEYLGKVKRSGTVVKPDFQNGILVQDPDQRGELLLVQDYEIVPGGLLYVVPKVGYFQTKQDFFNYYEKYYDCPRPSSGEVWINMPAVVDKVSGGWELREKGELEIK